MSRANLTKQTFGHLVALRYQSRAKWVCRCTCGQVVEVLTMHLLNGKVTSCGCQDSPRLDPSTTVRLKVLKGEVGITREDQQWLQHYRRQYLERYRQRGLIPPISKFT